MTKPFLILIDGPMGSGKSTVAEILKKRFHKKIGLTALISLDRLKRIVSGYKTNSKLHLNLSSVIGIAMTKEYLKNSINVIVEKAFTKEEFINFFINSLKGEARILVYQLEAPIDLRIKRINKRKLHAETKKKPTLIRIRSNTLDYVKYKYKKAIVFDSSKLNPNQIVNKIMQEIK